jgi:hypothetical protein
MSESLQGQIEEAIVDAIRDLSLAGLSSENIVRQLVPLDRDISPTSLPAIRIGPGGSEQIDLRRGTNAADDIGYPVQVVMRARANQDLAAGSGGDAWLHWREQIVQAFHNHRLSDVPSVFQCIVEPREIVAPNAWFQQNLWVSALVVRCTARRSR